MSSESAGTFAWVWSYLRRHRVSLLLAALAMFFVAVTRALYAGLVGPALRLLLGEGPGLIPDWAPAIFRAGDRAGTLALLAGLTLVAALVKAVAWYAQRMLMFRAALGFIADVRKDLYGHLLRLRPQVLLDARRGDLATRIASDPRQLVFLVDPGLENVTRIGITVLVVGALAIWLDPLLGTIALAVWPVLVFIMVRTARRARNYEGREAGDRGQLAGQVGEVASMIPLVRAYGAEPEAARIFAEQVETTTERAFQGGALHARTGPLVELVAAVASAVLLAVAGLTTAPGPEDVAHLLSFFGACFFLFAPVRNLGYALESASWALAAVDRLRALFAMTPEPVDPAGTPLATFAQQLHVEDLHCHLGGNDVLRGVSLTICPGESVALVGASGSGKSTLLAILLRFVEPGQGRVLLDGQDIRSLDRRSVRALFSWVTQDPVLFADTVAQNVSLGGGPAAPERLASALRAASAEGFVAALPEGAETRLGEGGAPLSVGQRQRLCIARALYREAPVLLFDEPTSALDGVAEAEVSDTIEALLGTRTVLLVSHRLSTVRRCSRIVVLDAGRVVQDGNLDEVWRADTAFARLFGAPPVRT